MRAFARINLGAEPAPVETTVCRFRHLLEKNDLGLQMFLEVAGHLHLRGFGQGRDTIVDATIIEAPSSTKNADRAKGPEMRQTK
jgi:IS5 family transposase